MANTGLRRFISAIPDAVTAGVFLFAWIDPLGWYEGLVKNLVLVLLVEFLVVHSAGFLGMSVLDQKTSRARRSAMVLGLSAFYMMFVLAFSYSMAEWWPIPMFLWLLASKFISIWVNPTTPEEERTRMVSQWGLAVAFYLAGVFAGIMLPLPRLGLTPSVVGALGLPGEGEWISKPHTAIAAGFIYFSLLALMKWRDWKLPPNSIAHET